MACPKQLELLQVNPVTGECFIRLPAPNDNVFVTAVREEDTAPIQSLLSDSSINRWLYTVPIPYTMKHAEDWMSKAKQDLDTLMGKLAAGEEFVDSSPVRSIMERKEDGSMEFIGDITIRRLVDMSEAPGGNEENKARLIEENLSRPPGDPQTYWTIGYYLSPSHQGKGIMSAALRALLSQWAIPKMGVRKVVGLAFVGNEGSKRVFEKNGFKLRETRPDYIICRGELRGLHILDWEMRNT